MRLLIAFPGGFAQNAVTSSSIGLGIIGLVVAPENEAVQVAINLISQNGIQRNFP